MLLPPALLARLDTRERTELLQFAEIARDGYSTQYEIERRSYNPLEYDDPFTFAWGLRQRGFGRTADGCEPLSGVFAHASGFRQSFRIGPLTVRPYRFGSEAPADVHLERLNADSHLKEFVALDNASRMQLAFDLRSAMNVPSADRAECSSNQLVIALYGNPQNGRAGIFFGAPLPELTEGSYWEWVTELAGPQAGPGEVELPQAPSPRGPAPYDRGPEPALPLRPRRRDERERS